LPVQLRKHLAEHEVHSARWTGLDTLKNGTLLAAAVSRGYEVLLTVDDNLRHQNKISKYELGVIVIRVERNTMPFILPKLGEIREALKRIAKGKVIVVGDTE
jgi:tetraacyldisaccharide-1-P 4'-kinase